tara:strand:+ start:90 stop:293 length:204 start_codon:yes stop_codon:yes gene_type:complete
MEREEYLLLMEREEIWLGLVCAGERRGLYALEVMLAGFKKLGEVIPRFPFFIFEEGPGDTTIPSLLF